MAEKITRTKLRILKERAKCFAQKAAADHYFLGYGYAGFAYADAAVAENQYQLAREQYKKAQAKKKSK